MATFSPWYQWDERNRCGHRGGPGVYLLARFEEGPPDAVDESDRNIVLIAETHGQTLDKRWQQFQYSAAKGGGGHAGGCTFHNLFGNGADQTVPPWLYVSARPVPDGVADVQGHVQDLKNRLLAAYQDRHGLLPCCNVRGPVERDGPAAPVVPTPEEPVALVAVVEPPVTFGPWCRWDGRAGLAGLDAAGVYALACFDADPPGEVDVLDSAVVYIGETCENTLAGRLAQFNRSAFLGKDGHSGGWSFRTRCAGQGDRLYVAVFPVASLHEPHRSAFIRHAERDLLWRYVRRWNRRPVCNSK